MWRRTYSLTKHRFGLGFLRRSFSSERSGKRFVALWGNGDYGRLGLGTLDSQWTPAVCNALQNKTLQSIACGGAHTLFLTDDGCVYATGLNDCGQLGISEGKQYLMEPVRVLGDDKKIMHVAAGYNHSCAITVDGELYMWGKNTSGQLGLGKKAPNIVPLPTKVEHLDGIRIKMTALGIIRTFEFDLKEYFSCFYWVLQYGGEAFSWGMGGSGRLGHGHESGILGLFKSYSEYTPRLIKDLEGVKVKYIAAGLLNSACIDENGFVYIFGERGIDKLHLKEMSNATKPSLINELPYSQQVACGGYHTCVLTNSGELYTWGSNENGCLGIGSPDAIHLPEKVRGPFLRSSVSQVSCGWKHTAAISEGRVFTWGWGGSYGTFSEVGHSSAGQLVNSACIIIYQGQGTHQIPD
ncbi:hypothetical protein PIB30_050628 [Stylosanthes scabra]|uniref:RCC1-like domain-containing protein n=1 Tax=Stylosanthes scabra TaxID=79078 RepID=A0ABU6RIE3_9FABA|nr:hypothetical protein [Stylosanthes scabra]